MQGWRIALWVGLVAASLWFLWSVRSVLLPFAISLVLAALLDPVIRKLVKRGVKRPVAILSVITSVFLVIALVLALAAPTVASQVTALGKRTQELTRSIIDDGRNDNFFIRWSPAAVAKRADSPSGQLDRLLVQYGPTLEQLGLPSTRRGIIDQYINRNRERINQVVQGAFDAFFGAVGAVFGQLFFAILVPILVTMMLFEMEGMKGRSYTWIPPSLRQSVLSITRDVSDVFFSYLRGISMLVLYFTIVQCIVLYALNLPYALLLGIVFGSFYLIPLIGNFISGFFILLIMGFTGVTGNAMFSLPNSWLYGALVTVIYLTIGWVFDTFVNPRLVGNSVGLNPIVSLFVVMCGNALFGLPGMIVAYPLAGAVKVILDRIIRITSATTDRLDLPAIPIRHRRSTVES